MDLGSGRRELSYLCAWAGANVTGIDYSCDVVAIAQETFSSRPEVQCRLEYRMEDALSVVFSESAFDAIVATDFVEYIESSALDKVLANNARWLAPQGRLVIHTSLNAFVYGKTYSKKRKNAEDAGLFLPSNTSTFYEDVMHVNEQTPARLRRTLRRYFKNVIVWVAPQPMDTGSLGRRRCSKDEYGERMCIFAVASNAPLQKSDVLSSMTQYPLKEPWSAELEVLDCPVEVRMGEKFSVSVRFHNTSSEMFSSMPPNPVHLSYHWKDPTGKTMVHDGQRTRLPFPLVPRKEINMSIDVCVSYNSGLYILEITAVNECAF